MQSRSDTIDPIDHAAKLKEQRMGTTQIYSTMERSELERLREEKLAAMRSIQKEIHKLKKKFKSGFYDRQVICELIISFQSQSNTLIATVEGINKALSQKLTEA